MKLDRKLFKSIVEFTPLISIDLIVENEDGEYLFGLRKNKPAQDFWFVPGGRVLKDETLDSAFKRLTQVELGIERNIQEADFLGVYQHFYNDNFSGDGFSTHYIVLGMKFRVNNLSELPEEQHNDYCWLTPQRILQDRRIHDNSRAYFDKSLADKMGAIK